MRKINGKNHLTFCRHAVVELLHFLLLVQLCRLKITHFNVAVVATLVVTDIRIRSKPSVQASVDQRRRHLAGQDPYSIVNHVSLLFNASAHRWNGSTLLAEVIIGRSWISLVEEVEGCIGPSRKLLC